MSNRKLQALFVAMLTLLLPSAAMADNVAKVGDVAYETLREAIQTAADASTNVVVDLTADAVLDITAWDGAKNKLSIGKDNTETITINGNGHTLTFDQKDSDWNNVATMNDAKTVLTLNNMSITNSDYNDGPWNRHDINFNCAVVLNSVTSDKALAFKNSATLKDVTVTETGSVYAIWISPRTEGQKVEIDGLSVKAERGIKVDDQYVDNATDLSLDIRNSAFETTKKAAILVKSSAKVAITASNLDITKVAADNENAVWVDEDKATDYGNVTLTSSDVTMAPEGGTSAYEATIIADGQPSGYYKTLAAAIAAAQASETVSINKAGTYTLPNLSNNITVKGEVEGVVFNHTSAGNIASIPNGATFQNVKFTVGNVDYHGFLQAGTINMENCIIDGKLFSYGDMNFTGCQFTQSNSDYHMWCYAGDLTYTNCTFTNSATGKFLNIYNEDNGAHKVTASSCKFVNNGSSSKAALNVKATAGSNLLDYEVKIENCTTEGAFPAASSSAALVVLNDLVQVDDRPSTGTDKIVVTQDGEVIYKNGVAVETIKIGTVEELKAFRDAVNSGKQYKDTKVVLTADLDLSSEANWTPIGNLVAYPGQSFDGVFDGNGHTISHLTVIDNTPNHAVAALFGSVVNGTIKNLTVKDVNIQSSHYAAGIVAYTSDKPTIENCHVIGGTIISTPELVGNKYDNGDKVGGIMGYCTAGTTITNCSVEGVNITGYRDLGGICGYAGGTVTDCTVKDVTITQDDTNGYKSDNLLATTVGTVVGLRSANAAATNEANTTENVELKHVGVVAKIGNNSYTTFEAAFAALQDGETITLLTDCAGNGIKATQGKFTTGITVDFDGHTYTMDGSTVGSSGTETQAFQLLKDNKITFKNGTITSEKALMLIQNYSDLTLQGMTLTLNNPNYTSAYTLSNNNGNVAIDGSTINANPAGGFAFDVCRYASYKSVNVEVKGVSVINGNIEISASRNDAKDGFSLTLTAGKLDGSIVMDPSAAAAMAATPDKAVIAKSADFAVEAPKDYKWVEAENGMQKLVACEYVAQVGENKYETFEAAAEEAGEDVIMLLANIEDDYTLVSGKTIKVNKKGKTINIVTTEGCLLNETTEGDVTIYTATLLSESDVVLTDGEAYTYTADTEVKSATFVRKFPESVANIYLSWFVPFDYTITAEDANKFEFYKINMIANAPNPGVSEESDKVWIYINKMEVGDVLRGNMPYLFKPLEAIADGYEFKADNAVLKAKNEGVLISTETMLNKYSFYGTYDKITLSPNDAELGLYMGNKGSLSFPETQSINVGAYRWIIRVSSKNGIAYVREFHFVDDSESTGVRNVAGEGEAEAFYTLDGVKVEAPAKGIYVMKCNDGTTKKVLFK